MIYFGKQIAYFFKPLAEEAMNIKVACFVADSPILIFKWAKKAIYRELFAAKAKVINKRVDKFYKIKNLHAKIYIFDDRIFLSSANLTYTSLFIDYEHAIEVTETEEKKKVLEFLSKLRREHEGES